ncbi:hypothetical protein B0H13DRAFT_2513075 [Mycena leptocephala]|nr:hypothetical protein B0H13DRAFT_2513075 [Mycena leptocephala]
MPAPAELLSYMDTSAFIARLSEAVAIPSIPARTEPSKEDRVGPAVKSDGWDTEPFILTEEKDRRLVGRGNGDAKGVLGWFGVLQWHYEHKKEMPVNLVTCFLRGWRRMGARDWLVEMERDGWFKGGLCCIISFSLFLY